MKNIIIAITLIVSSIGVMAQDHPHGNMSHGKKNMDSQDGEVMHFEVSADFQKQLNGVYQASLALNDAFVAGNANDVKLRAIAVSNKMKAVNMSLLSGDAHMAWMAYMKPINSGLTTINQSADIAAQRDAYSGVAEGLYKSVKAFGVGETVYYQYCPMKKASWLSNNEDIKNPYYGSMMLTCGSTKEVLN